MKKIIIIIGVILIIGAVIGISVFNYYNYSGELIGIRSTYTYHRDNCAFVKKASADKLIFIDSLKEAAEHEYRPCKSCNPPSNEKYVEEVKIQKELEKKQAQKELESRNAVKEHAIPMSRPALVPENVPFPTSRYSLPEYERK